ncbi:MAG: transposase [Cytophagaceae bacterium]
MTKTRIPLEPDEVYHVWTHANGSENLFRTDENFRYFLEKYSLYLHSVVETFAYCLMPNHLHLMVKVRSEQELRSLPKFKTLKEPEFPKAVSLRFSHLFNCYTQSYNRKYERKGSLFIDSFHRKKINSDEYFTSLIAYIHNNPIHHGFVKDLNDWPYSSWHAYLSDKHTRINRKEALEWFGGKETFIKTHQDLKPEKFANIFEI